MLHNHEDHNEKAECIFDYVVRVLEFKRKNDIPFIQRLDLYVSKGQWLECQKGHEKTKGQPKLEFKALKRLKLTSAQKSFESDVDA